MKLVIANKNYSSWSMRPWIAMKAAGIAFEEVFVPFGSPLGNDEFKQRLAAYTPAGMVPVLIDGDTQVWETLAILEYLAELYPEKQLWPENRVARAMARSVSAEMHSSFADVRNEWAMNLRRPKSYKPLSESGRKQAARIEQIWRDCRVQYGAGGPFLFGAFTAADAMYAPVVTRFDTYGGELAPDIRSYVDAVLAMPAMKEWYAAAAAETYPEPYPDE